MATRRIRPAADRLSELESVPRQDPGEWEAVAIKKTCIKGHVWLWKRHTPLICPECNK